MEITVGAIGLVVILILATLIWSSTKQGSIVWKWKNRLFGEVNVAAKRNQGQKLSGKEQIQDGGEGNEMSSSSSTPSKQLQKGGKNNRMDIK